MSTHHLEQMPETRIDYDRALQKLEAEFGRGLPRQRYVEQRRLLLKLRGDEQCA